LNPSLDRAVHAWWKDPQLIILGIVLVVIGLVAAIPILETIGGILVVVGLVLWVLGSMGRAIGGRKHYY
jgi:membrane-bound ClpP family serine protease